MKIIGIVNVTPDSFSDGGLFTDHDAAIARGLELAAQGAEIIDVGGESTRPGAARVDARTQRRRVIAVVRELAAHDQLDIATAALSCHLATRGTVWAVRVHNVSATATACEIGRRLDRRIPTL